ncbi:MAG: hypothetical protein ACI3ZO_08360 [Candidatus Cryptobacteroides sp.]|nr:NigD-like C-terminal domain-containing protein [Bacteroidales bacterium]
MNTSTRLIINAILTAAVLLTSSCSKDEIIMSNCATMGFLNGETQIKTDEGVIYNIVSGKTAEGIDPGTRVLITCDILNKTYGRDDEYDVKSSGIKVPVSGSPLALSSTDLKEWPDAITVTDAWLSGGYLNLYCVWIGRRGSSATHRTALIYDDLESDADTVAFILAHDGQGEGFYEDSQNTSDLTTIYEAATFPVRDYIPGGNVTLKLSFTWHKSDGQYIYPQTEGQSISYSVPASGLSPLTASAEPSTKATISPLMTLLP